MGYIFGGNTGVTYEQLQRQREMADMLAKGGPNKITSWGEGLNSAAGSIASALLDRRADKGEAKLRTDYGTKFDEVLGALTGRQADSYKVSPTDYDAAPRGPHQDIADDTMAALGKPTQDDRELLAKTLQAEAGGEGIEGLIAAGAVIANRVGTGNYGEGLRGVIMKPGQFSAWNGVTGYAGGEGAIDMAKVRPSQEAYAAADAILSGRYEDPTGGATHYYNPNVADPRWGAKNGGNWTTIGNHIFGNADAGSSRPNRQGGTQYTPEQIMQVAALAADPMASPEHKAQASFILQQYERQVAENDPMRQLQLEKGQLEIEAMRNPKPDMTSGMKEYEAAVRQGFQGTFMDYKKALAEASRSQTNVTTNVSPGEGPLPDADLRKKLNEAEGTLWSGYLEQGAKAAGTVTDLSYLAELAKVAPQGPLEGRLAQAFPGFNDAASAFQSVVSRVAPTMRTPGSGSTSDIEVQMFLDSLPALRNRPEANAAIVGMLQGKAQLDQQRASIITAYQNNEIGADEARSRINEIDGQSVMSPDLQAMIHGLGGDSAGPVPPDFASSQAVQSAIQANPNLTPELIWKHASPELRKMYGASQ